MAFDTRTLMKVFGPRIFARAIMTLDKSTAVVVSSCWLAAFVILVMAAYTVHSAVAAKKLAADAAIAEPVLPVATTTGVNPREGQIIVDRLQHQFPDIKFDSEGGRSISVRTMDGSKFHQWIIALSYVDAMDPQFRWSLSDFCVGHCGQDLMKASIVGQKIMFSLPQQQ